MDLISIKCPVRKFERLCFESIHFQLSRLMLLCQQQENIGDGKNRQCANTEDTVHS